MQAETDGQLAHLQQAGRVQHLCNQLLEGLADCNVGLRAGLYKQRAILRHMLFS